MNVQNQDIAAVEEGRTSTVMFSAERDKVLLIGDSLRVGYCTHVQRFLKADVEVTYPDENCRNTQYILTNLRRWKNMFRDVSKVKLVCFNAGHWDIAHWNCSEESLTSEPEYARNIKKIIIQLRLIFPNAKIVFFTTSPINVAFYNKWMNPRTNEEVKRYNELAVAVADREGVIVEDMNSVIAAFGNECYKDYAHLTDEYNEKLAMYVAGVVDKHLS